VRLRLALWFTSTLTVALVLYAGLVYALVRRSLLGALDRELHEDLEYAEAMLEVSPDGSVSWRARSEEVLEEPESELLEVRAADGRLVYRDPSTGGGDPALLERLGPESVRLADGRPVRRVTRSYLLAGRQLWITVARSEEPARDELSLLLLMLTLGVPVAAILSGLGGYLLARRALAPVDRIAERASAITAERLSERLPVENPHDELGRLATVFNGLFERLERSFERLGRFTADASHELRTPLTAQKSVGEVGLREPRSAEEYREIIGSMLEEADRLARLVKDLLLLSRADAEQVGFARQPVDLTDLARAAAAHMGVLAEEKRQSLEIEANGRLEVAADEALLRLALLNLIDNAIRHSPEGARIRLRATRNGHRAVLEVRDTGPGIAAEHRERVFDRFYRVDPGRSRERGGAGLGLSIARWAVELHGGRIELESELGQGSTFRIVLPPEKEST
jgi:heavy metal sensor kinase